MTDTKGAADPTTVFSRNASNYDKSRVGYPQEFVHQILDNILPNGALADKKKLHFRKRRPCIVDMGAGTGRLGKAFLELGCDVIFVEPSDRFIEFMENDPALKNNRRVLGIIKADAANVKLPDGVKADVIVMGDAAHWLDAKALANLRQILKSQGKIAAFSRFWSPEGPVTQEVHGLLLGMEEKQKLEDKQHGLRYKNSSVQFMRSPENLRERLGKHLLDEEGRMQNNFTFFHEYSQEELLNYFRSCSFSAEAIEKDEDDFKENVIDLLWKCAKKHDDEQTTERKWLTKDGKLKVPYEINAVYEAPEKVRGFVTQLQASRAAENIRAV